MKNAFIVFIILSGIWVLLNGYSDYYALGTGIVASLLIAVLLCRRCNVFSDLKLSPKAFIYTLLYVFVFILELIKSNLDMARRVISPSLPINPGIIEAKTTLKSSMARMILANSITLTPGTFTVEIQNDSLFIHRIDVDSDDIEANTQAIVRKFEKYLEEIYA